MEVVKGSRPRRGVAQLWRGNAGFRAHSQTVELPLPGILVVFVGGRGPSPLAANSRRWTAISIKAIA